MVQSIEHLHPDLQLEPLGELEGLDKTEVQIPVMRRGESISTGAVLTWRGNTKGLSQINPAGQRVDRFEEHRAGEGLARKCLQLRRNRGLHAGAGFVISVGRK